MPSRRTLLVGGSCAALAAAAGYLLPKTHFRPSEALAADNPQAYAEARFLYHWNCTISLVETFAPRYGFDLVQARKLATPFAAGMWIGGTCGALVGSMFALGMAFGRKAEKDADSDAVLPLKQRELARLFKAEFGALDCSTLMGTDMGTPEGVKEAAGKGLFTSKCPVLVKASVRLVEQLTA